MPTSLERSVTGELSAVEPVVGVHALGCCDGRSPTAGSRAEDAPATPFFSIPWTMRDLT